MEIKDPEFRELHKNSESGFGELHGEYDWDEVDPATAILDLIAEHAEVTDPASILDSTLHTYIDTDALNTLVQNGSTISINLKISHYLVQIHGNSVGVTPAEDDNMER